MGYLWLVPVLLSGVTEDEVREMLDSTRRRWVQRVVWPCGAVGLTIWGRTLAGAGVIASLRQLHGRDYQVVNAAGMNDAQLAEFAVWEAAQ